MFVSFQQIPYKLAGSIIIIVSGGIVTGAIFFSRSSDDSSSSSTEQILKVSPRPAAVLEQPFELLQTGKTPLPSENNYGLYSEQVTTVSEEQATQEIESNILEEGKSTRTSESRTTVRKPRKAGQNIGVGITVTGKKKNRGSSIVAVTKTQTSVDSNTTESFTSYTIPYGDGETASASESLTGGAIASGSTTNQVFASSSGHQRNQNGTLEGPSYRTQAGENSQLNFGTHQQPVFQSSRNSSSSVFSSSPGACTFTNQPWSTVQPETVPPGSQIESRTPPQNMRYQATRQSRPGANETQRNRGLASRDIGILGDLSEEPVNEQSNSTGTSLSQELQTGEGRVDLIPDWVPVNSLETPTYQPNTGLPVTKSRHVEASKEVEYSAQVDLPEKVEELKAEEDTKRVAPDTLAPLPLKNVVRQEQEQRRSVRGRKIRVNNGLTDGNDAKPVDQTKNVTVQQSTQGRQRGRLQQPPVQSSTNQGTDGLVYRNSDEKQRHTAELHRVKEASQDHASYLLTKSDITDADLYDDKLYQKLSPMYREVFQLTPDILETLSAAREAGMDIKGDHPTYLCVKRLLEVQFDTVIQDAQNDHANNEQLYYQPFDGKRMVFFHRVENHWFLSARDENGQVLIMDSMYSQYRHHSAYQQLANLYRLPGEQEFSFRSVPVQQQHDVIDCFYFSAAFAYHFLKGDDPAELAFNQDKLRSHIFQCILAGQMNDFELLDDGLQVQRCVAEQLTHAVICSCGNYKTEPVVACLCGGLFHKACHVSGDAFTTANFKCNTLGCLFNSNR